MMTQEIAPIIPIEHHQVVFDHIVSSLSALCEARAFWRVSEFDDGLVITSLYSGLNSIWSYKFLNFNKPCTRWATLLRSWGSPSGYINTPPSISLPEVETIKTCPWPRSFPWFGKGRLSIFRAPLFWSIISGAWSFLLKIFWKATHCSRVCPFLRW